MRIGDGSFKERRYRLAQVPENCKFGRWGLVWLEIAKAAVKGSELCFEGSLHGFELGGVFGVVGKVALFVGIVGEVIELIAFEIGGVGSGGFFFSIASAGDGGEVAERFRGVVGDDIEVSAFAFIIPFVEDCAAFFEGHVFEVFGVTDRHVFPVADSYASGVAEFEIKEAIFGRFFAVQVGQEAFTVEVFCVIFNFCEVEDGGGKVHV